MDSLILKKQSKLEATLKSRNFFISVISLVLLIFKYNGIDIPDGTDENIYDAFASKELFAIVSILIPNFLNPILKMVRTKFDTSFIKSINFWTQFLTVVLIGVSSLGIFFPENAAVELLDSISGGEVTRIILAIVINVINPLIHFFQNRKERPVIVESNLSSRSLESTPKKFHLK